MQNRRRTWMVALVIVVLGGAAWLRSAGQPPAAATRVREDAYRANNVGVAYLEQYNHEAAAASFRRALELDPQLALARINLAIALFYLPDPAGSLKEAQAASAADPQAPQPHYILGLLAKSDNRVDDAVREFRAVLAIDGGDLGARVNLAQLLMQRREYDEAVNLLRPAVAAEPYHVTATYNLGVALTRSGNAEEGQRVMAAFQKLREGGYGTTFSNNYLEQGRYAEAIASTGAEAALVDRATPAVRFVEGARLPASHMLTFDADPDAPTRLVLDTLAGGLTLVDLDRDGDLDLLDVSAGRLRAFRNEKGAFADASETLGLAAVGAAPGLPPAVGVVAGDYDNDERVDLFVVGIRRHLLLRQTESGRFEDVSARAQIPAAAGLARAAAFVDVDHDGDLDLVVVGVADAAQAGARTLTPAPGRLWRNNGNGAFTDISTESGLAAVALHGVAVAPVDFDNRRDVDLMVAADDRAPLLLKNMRDGTFRDVASEVGLDPRGHYSSLTTGDVNKDGYGDFFFTRADGPGLLALSDGRGRFTAAPPLPDAGPAFAAQLVDYDNDGLLDLVALGPSGLLEIWRNQGAAWQRVTAAAVPGGAPCTDCLAMGRLVAGDLDGDGDVDLVMKTIDAKGVGAIRVARNEGGNRHPSLAVRLTGRVSNRSAIGSKVELRAGSLRSRLETSSASPAVAPADLVFGLGPRTAADVVRVLWPAGILQAEIPGDAKPPAAGSAADTAAAGRTPGAGTLALTELDRKPSSCPYLYTWNGERFEFLTDFMGGGEMGYQHAPGVVNTPDPEEFTRIDGDRLRPRDGRYELRVTNELEEALFIDRLQLVVVDHPSRVEMHPREGLVEPPFPAFELYGARDLRAPLRATDHRGRDVLDRVRDRDRRFVDDLPLERIRGYAARHALTLDLGASAADRASDGPLLLLTGWTDYAFSSDNIAAHQAGLALEPPSLQVKDASGAWRTVVKAIGIPVGRPQTVVVDLTGKFLSASREVRLVTSMRIYWDQIRVGARERAAGPASPRLTRLDPRVADLRWRGFSAEVSPDGREPFEYDYARVSPVSPWKTMPGRYTREGDVRELLHAADDRFVVSRPGDEIALSFDARALPPLPAGWSRTFLLHSIGYSKEMDRNSASPDLTWPLPFRSMTRYPYAAPEAYPDTPRHREYLERWNTRVVGRAVPPIELATPNP